MAIRSSGLAGLIVLLLLSVAGCDSTSPEVRTNPPDALYVCNQGSGTVSVINPASDSVVTTVDLVEKEAIESRRPKPHHVVVEPDGSAWYVSLINENAVVKLNAQNEVVGRAPFPAPGMLSLDPDSDRLYAGHTLSDPTASSTIAVIPTDMSSVQEVSVSIDRPHGVKVRPAGEYVYSSSLTTKQIVAVDPENDNDLSFSPILPGTAEEYIQMDISADGRTAFLTKAFGLGETKGQVHVLSLADPTTPTFVDSIEVGARPWHPQLSDDGQTLYVGSKGANAVYAIDTETFDTTTITGEGLAQPHGSALSPDGQTLYVSNKNQNGTYPSSGGTVVAIDTETNDIRTVIEVGNNPAGINTRWQP